MQRSTWAGTTAASLRRHGADKGRPGLRATAIGVSALVCVLALNACGGPSAHPDASSKGSTSGTPTTSSAGVGSGNTGDAGHIIPAGPGPTTLPTEDPITPVRTQFDTGQQVVISAHGFEPLQLSADRGQPVVWTNDSGAPQKITIPVASLRSPTIPPGAQFVWTPDVGGYISYTSPSGFSATLILQ